MNTSPHRPDAAADPTGGPKLDPADFFDAGEIAILRSFFGLEPRPGDPPLSQLYEPFYTEEYLPEPFPDEDDEPHVFPSVPIRLRPTKEVGRVNEVSEAVARICLGEVQDRLPQYWGSSDGGSRLRFPTPTPNRSLKPPNPEELLKINWAFSMPGIDWPEDYYVTSILGFDRYVVTVSVDSPESLGASDLALGWFHASEGVLEGSRRILIEWWREFAATKTPAWIELSRAGLIDADEAYRMRALVWPEESKSEDPATKKRSA